MPKIFIAAGGTGGHIYPAVAIAEAMQALDSQTQITFVGTPSGLENKIIPAKGFPLVHVNIGRLHANAGLSERIKTLLKLPLALIQSFVLLLRARPDFVLGVGGYASGPVVLLAALMGFRTGIWEPNAVPGMANRILSRFVDDCWVVFGEARARLRGRKIHESGMPVRREIEALEQNTREPDGKFHVLVVGGSQGARALNSCWLELLQQGGAWLNKIKVVHQTGAADFTRIEEGYRLTKATIPEGVIEVYPFLDDMNRRYAWADLVVSRSGTGTLSELAACGKPAVLVPFPFAADDHQRKNAESFVAHGAARMVLQKDLSPERLKDEISLLIDSPEQMKQLSVQVRSLHRPQAASKLAAEIFSKLKG